jgi:hypothetical protein
MNKREAQRIARSGDISIGELRHFIKEARGRGGMSRVNPTLALERVLDIYEAALAGREDAEKPVGMKLDVYSPSGRMKPSRDSLTICNILRDCA